MKNKIIHTQNSRNSCIGYNEEWLLISSKELHTDFQTLLHYTKSFYKSGTNGYGKIDLDRIKELCYHKNYSAFYLRYIPENKPSKLKKYHFSIQNNEIRAQFCSALAEDCALSKKEEKESPFAGITLYITSIILTLLFTYSAYYISNGGLIHHRKASVALVSELIQHINPMLIMIIGGLITLYFLYKILRNYINPTKTIIYTK